VGTIVLAQCITPLTYYRDDENLKKKNPGTVFLKKKHVLLILEEGLLFAFFEELEFPLCPCDQSIQFFFETILLLKFCM
jgi:hypothetical protein